ncbi:MAG: LamG-like jellyroll fold domain-containing protein [Planctomycetota bacterium]
MSARFEFYRLEDRVLLSGDSVSDPLDVDPQFDSIEQLLDQVNPEGESRQTENASVDSRLEVLIVDANVEDRETLIDGLRSTAGEETNWFVIELDVQRNGVEQITESLRGLMDVDAIHLVSHGNGSGVQLGNTWLDQDSIQAYGSELTSWRDALGDSGDLLIYGCDLASTGEGQNLIEMLAAACDCDVAASDDVTGHASLGGDWDFEYRIGMVESDDAFSDALKQSWVSSLVTPTDLVVASSEGGLSLNSDGGNDAFLQVTDSSIFGGSRVTMEFQISDLQNTGTSSTLFSNVTGAGTADFKINSDGRLSFIGFASTTTHTQLFDGEDHSVAFSFDGTTGAIRYYVDGLFVESIAGPTGTLIGGDLIYGQDQDSLGGAHDASETFSGTFRDIRLFNDIRTDEEILASYASVLPSNADAMAANWRFDGLTSDGVVDAVTGTNTLTLQTATGTGFSSSTPTLSIGPVDENALDGTVVGTITGVDATRDAAIASLLAADTELVYSAETGKFYRGYTTWVDFATAQSNASTHLLNGVAGQLATIGSAHENQIAFAIADSANVDLWLGGTDSAVEGEWRWQTDGADGDQFWQGDSSGYQIGAYSNWDSGQPNDLGGEDHLALRDETGHWIDVDATTNSYYLVEWDADDVLDVSHALTYTITSQDVTGAFTIDLDTGVVSVADGTRLDFESLASHDITVQVEDSDNNVYSETFAIALNDLVESPSTPTALSSGIELNTDGGNDSYLLSTNASSVVGGLTQLTIESKVRFADDGQQILFTYSTSAYNDALHLQQANTHLRFAINDDIYDFTQIDYSTLKDGEVHDLAISWDNTHGDIAIYIDGDLVETATGVAVGLVVDADASNSIAFGVDTDSPSGGFQSSQTFRGTHYDFRIWDEVRSASEIAYNADRKFDAGDLPNGLVANWQMDGFNGSNEVVDVVAGNNLSIGHASGAGFTASTPVEDLHVSEHAVAGTVVGVVVPTAPEVTDDVVSDGRFLAETDPGSFQVYSNGESFGDWTVTDGQVVLAGTVWDSTPLGGRSVELAGSVGGSIAQNLATVVGQTYQVVFVESGDWTGDTSIEYRVSAGGVSRDFAAERLSDWSYTNMLWNDRSLTFTATDTTTTLSFDSLESGSTGAVIGDIRVIEVPQAVNAILNDDPTLSYDAATEKFYRYDATDRTWDDAVTNATTSLLNGVAGQLVRVESEYENELIRSMNNHSYGVFLGASDADVEGTWRWYEGNEAGDQFWAGNGSGAAVGGFYTNFASGNPDDFGTGQDHLSQLRSNGLWDDVPGDTTLLHSVVQWDAVYVLSSHTFSLTDDAGGRFSIDAATGEVTVANGTLLDSETAASHNVTVQVTDAAGNAYSESLAIAVDNAAEAEVAGLSRDFVDELGTHSPVLHLRLDETTGTTAIDAVGGNDGTYNGVTLGAAGVISGNGAVSFNNGEHIEVGHSADLMLDEGTIQLWFQTSDITQDGTLFSKDATGFGGGGHIGAYLHTNGEIEVRLQSDSAQHFVRTDQATQAISENVWNHFAFSFGSGGMKLYLNGELLDSDTYTGGLGTSSGGSGNTQSLLIGANNAFSTLGTTDAIQNYYEGDIDEFAILGRQLSDAEVLSLGTSAQDYAIDEDVPYVFGVANGNAVTVGDTIAGNDRPMRVTLSVNDGMLTLSQTTGLTFVDGANSTAFLVVEGTESDLNSALEGMSFTPDANFNGSVLLSVDAALSVDLDAHYTFESGSVSGSTVSDQSAGAAYDATLFGNATIVNDAERGDVLSLDGTGDYAQIAGLIGQPANVTLSGWINATGIDTLGGVLLSMGSTPALYLNASGRLEGYYESGGTDNFIQSQESLLGTGWRHVAVSMDATNSTMTLYLDGVAVETVSTVGPIDYDNDPDTYIGRAGDGGTGYDFQGLIDDARVYSRSLSAEEIAAIAGDQATFSDSVAITVNAVNDQPVFNNLDGNPTFVEGGAPVVLDSDASYFDIDITRGEDSFSNVNLTLQRSGGANAEDIFSATGLLGSLIEGGSFTYNGSAVGTVEANSAGTLDLRFNPAATQADVDGVIQSIAYSNSSDSPPANVTIAWSMEDSNGGAQGSGGNLFATGSTTVTIVDTPEPATFSVPIAQSIDEDTALTFSVGAGNAITIESGSLNDPIVTTRLSVTQGTLTLATTTGITFLEGTGDGSASLVLSGNEAAINSAFDGLQYLGDQNYNGADTLTVSTGSASSAEANLYARFEFLGGATTDESGNGRDGSAVGDPSLTIDVERGDVMSFDGDDRITITNGTSGLGDEVTISAWVNLDAGQQENTFLSLGDEVYVVLDPTNASFGIGGRVGGFTSYSLDSSDRVAGSGWRHVALTLDDLNNELRVYLDGELARSSDFSGMEADWPTAASQDIIIGGLSDGSRAFVGSIDDARVYDRALTQAEIVDIMGDQGFATEAIGLNIDAVNDSPVFTVTPSETEAVIDGFIANPSTVISGDLDSDGDLDVIGATNDGRVLWYANDGDGGFSTGVQLFNTAGYDFSSIATGDLNGDGDLDFVVTNNTPDGTEDGIFIFSNQTVESGVTTFSVSSMEDKFFDAYDVAVADIDGDSRLDIVVSFQSGEVGLYEQNSPGVFTASLAAAISTARGIDVGDIDGDGSLDIAVAGSAGVFWLENDSASDPTFTVRTALATSSIQDVAIANLDGDADLEIAYLRDQSLSTELGWLDGDGSAIPNFTQNAISSFGSFSTFGNLLAADVDANGGVDLVVSVTSSDELRVFENDGTGGFSVAAQTHSPDGPEWVDAADLDGDGDLDFITAQSGDSTLGEILSRGSGLYTTVHGTEDTTITGLRIQIDDVDANGADLSVTVSVGDGTVTIPTGAVTFSSGNSGSSVTFTGTVSEINAALNSFSFAPDPNFHGDTSIMVSVNDQGNTGSGGPQVSVANILLHLQSVNDAPVVTVTSSDANFTEQTPIGIDVNATLSDIDDATLQGATIRVSGNYEVGVDQLQFTDQNGISGLYNNSTGVLTLTGVASVVDYQTALRSIVFANSSNDPSTATRTIEWVVNDGDADSAPATRDVVVNAVNDDPTNAGSLPSDLTVTEDVLSSIDLSAVEFSDSDANGANLTVTLSTSTGGQLTLAPDPSLTFGGSATSRTITGTVANLNLYFNNASNIQYLHGTLNTFGNNADTVTIIVNDLGNTGSGGGTDQTLGSVNVDIAAVDDAPIVVTNTTLPVTEESTVTITNANLSASDVDNTADEIVYTLTSTPVGGSVRLNGSALGVGGTFTQDDIDNGRVTYRDSDDGETTSFDFTVSDGNTVVGPNQFNINGTPVNDTPVVSAPGAAYSVNEQTALSIEGTGFSVTDVDAGSGTMTATFTVGEGTLSLTAGDSGVSITANNAGTVSFTGNLSQINALLAGTSTGTIVYFNGSDTPSASTTLTLTVNDGGNTGTDPGLTGDASSEEDSAAQIINISSVNDAPTLTSGPGGGTYNENGSGTYFNNGLTIADVDSTDFDGGVLTTTISAAGESTDRLVVRDGGNVSVSGSDVLFDFGGGPVTIGSFTGGDGTNPLLVTFNANSTVASVEAVAQQVAFRSVSDDPSTAQRSLTMVVTDGDGGTSAVANRVMNVVTQNDAPSISVTGDSPTFTEDAGAVGLFSGAIVDAIEASDLIQQVTLTVDGLTDGSDEKLVVDGTTIELTNGNVESTTSLFDVGVTVSGSTATVTITRTGDFTTTETETLLNGLAYENTNEALSGGVRLVTLQTVTDDGGGTDTGTSGVASLVTLAGQNDAPVLDNSGSPSFLSITEDDVNNSGMTVADLLLTGAGGDPISDVDGDPEGVAITTRNDGRGVWQFSIDGGTSWQDIGTVTDASALLLRSTDLIRFNPDGDNGGVTQTIEFRGWDQSSGVAGTKVDTTSNGGTTAFSTSIESASVTSSDVNDAPVLDNSGTISLSNQNEDSGSPSGAVGTVITDFITNGGNVTDVDDASQAGIAITDADSTDGTWWYTLDGGTSWSLLGAVSESSARVLNASSLTRIYFEPNADFNGTISDAITFRAWDRSLGSNGSVQDASSNGGTSAFSSATETADLTVVAINDDPTQSGSLPTDIIVVEDVPTGLDLSGINLGDVDAGVGSMRILLTSDSNGEYFASNSGGVTVTGNGSDSIEFSGSLSDLNDYFDIVGNVQYLHPTSHLNGDDADIIYIHANDDGNTGAGGGSNVLLGSINVDITAVNDAPVVVAPSAAFSVNEQTNLSIEGTGFSVSDADGLSGTMTAVIEVGEGTVTIVEGDSGTTISSGNTSDTVTFTGTRNQIDALLTGTSTGTVTYFNSSDTPSSSTTITVTVNDGGNVGADPGLSGDAISEEGSTSQTINIVAQNDDPTNAGSLPTTITVTEDVLSNLDLSLVDFADADDAGGTLTVFLSTSSGGEVYATSGGGVSVTASGSTTVSFTGTRTSLNTYFNDPINIRYLHATPDLSGTSADIDRIIEVRIQTGSRAREGNGRRSTCSD